MSEKHYPYIGGGFDRIVFDGDGSVWVPESESAKLREQVVRWQSEWESERDYADQMEAKEKKAVAENDKLRELCAEMFEAVKCCCGEWCTKTVSNCDNNECGWHKCYITLCELGIEVEHD